MKKNFCKKQKQKKNKKNKFKFRIFFSKYYKKKNNLNDNFESFIKNKKNNNFENNNDNSFDSEKNNTIDYNSNGLEDISYNDLSEQEFNNCKDYNKLENTNKSNDFCPVKDIENNNYDIFSIFNFSESTNVSFKSQ